MSNRELATRTSERAHQLRPNARAWVNLWLTVHFFALALALLTNYASSDLQRRIQRVLAPYSVGLHQDYGGLPLEMTRGEQASFAHAFQIHTIGNTADDWLYVHPPLHAMSVFDHRWRTLEHLAALAANDSREDIIALLCEHCLRGQPSTITGRVDAVRFVRRGNVSYVQARRLVEGELSPDDVKARAVFTYRVVEMPGGRLKLLLEAEPTRTAKPLVK